MRYRFDQFELDTERFLLRAGDGEVHVEPLVFDLLAYLVERAGQVVTRDAIIDHVWKGRFVSDATVSSCIKSVRKALGDSIVDEIVADGGASYFGCRCSGLSTCQALLMRALLPPRQLGDQL